MLGAAGEKGVEGVITAWAIGGLPNCLQNLLTRWFYLS